MGDGPRQAFLITRRILLELVRTRRSLLFWVAFPVLMLLLFGFIYAGNGKTGPSFDAVAPGILIGAALFFSCLGGPIAVIVGERERRTLGRLLLAPLSPMAYVAGVAGAFAVVAAGQTLIVYGLAAVFGGRFHGSLLLGGSIVALSAAAYTGLGFAFGARFARRTEDVNGPVAAFGVPLLVLGGTFFPPRMLPSFLVPVAWLDPVFHMNEALRPVSASGAPASAVAPHLAFLAVFTALAVLAGARSYRSLLVRERRALR